MKDKELSKFSRKELLEMLIQQGEQMESLQKELDETKKQLNQRRIEISNSGSIAEAALRLNGVFQAAEAAAAQYLENIRLQAEANR